MRAEKPQRQAITCADDDPFPAFAEDAMSLPEIKPASHYFTPEHEQFRRTVRDWVTREIVK